MSYSQVHN